MRRRGNARCSGCDIPIFATESKWCDRCNITLSLSLGATRTTLRSRKLKNKSTEAAIVEVLSSDEERERQRLKQIEDAEEISDDTESSDDDVSDDLREDDPRVVATEGDGIFQAVPDERGVLLSRTFARCRFRPNDFPIVTLLQSASTADTPTASSDNAKNRPAGAALGPKTKTLAKKKAAPSPYFGHIDMYFLQNPDDYAASEYESSVDDDDDDCCVDLTRSDGNATDDDEYHAKRRRRRPVPDEPCFICECREAPDGVKTSRVQCPDCDGVYHRSCAEAYDGKQTGCLQCEDNDLVDDSELTEADLATTSQLFGVFHVKEELPQVAQTDDVSPSRLDDDDADEIDDMVETGATPDVVPDASQVKQTILAGWKRFLDEHTAAFDADFIAATRAIEAENGFKTSLESDLHKLFQHYTAEQAKADELERTQRPSPTNDSSTTAPETHGDAAPSVAKFHYALDEIQVAQNVVIEAAPSIPATVDLTIDDDDDCDVVEVSANPVQNSIGIKRSRTSGSPTTPCLSKEAPHDVLTLAAPSFAADDIIPSAASATSTESTPASPRLAKKAKKRIALITVPPPQNLSNPVQDLNMPTTHTPSMTLDAAGSNLPIEFSTIKDPTLL
ncbi:hypothetical protein H310_13931 [Aphanomyces invadans]|uniref:Uncharacterized protein n=1 Tax=Aphanomyces invadans TaxID=157072 RepID=A0A024TBY2_9STRA|nr:hypothetical protein H310_13931 [Aphanomyces invadans]ETV91548.1 hypothetical protein H310_13931 [Aphanomyces invadans]|eukprot:XP_008879816.1 hypothetical protein H310_13931 [Aphanomyces invadans]